MDNAHNKVISRVYDIQEKNEELKVLASLFHDLLNAQHSFIEREGSIVNKSSSIFKTGFSKTSSTPTSRLGGESFSEVLAVFEKNGLPGVLKLLSEENVTFEVKADALSALARHIRDKDPALTAQLAFMAWQYDPKIYRIKWYAYRLSDAHEDEKAHAILSLLSKDMKFGEMEERRNNKIKSNTRLSNRQKAMLSETELLGTLQVQIKNLQDNLQASEQLKKNLLNQVEEFSQKINQYEQLNANLEAQVNELAPKAQIYDQLQEEKKVITDILNQSIDKIHQYSLDTIQGSASIFNGLKSLLSANQDRSRAEQYFLEAKSAGIEAIPPNIHFLYGRFGMISKWIDLPNMTYDQYKATVLDTVALEEKLKILLDYQLPMLAQAASKFPIFYHISSSCNLPEPVIEQLKMAASSYNFLQIAFYDEDTLPHYKEIFKKRLVELNAGLDCMVSVSRIYEDDILHPSFFEHLNRYMRPEYADFCVSFPCGYYGLFNEKKYIKFANARIPNVPLGITNLARFNGYELISSSFLPPKNELEIDSKAPIIEDGSFAAYIFSLYSRRGGSFLKHGKEANYIEEKYFSNNLADFKQVNDYFCDIFSS